MWITEPYLKMREIHSTIHHFLEYVRFWPDTIFAVIKRLLAAALRENVRECEQASASINKHAIWDLQKKNPTFYQECKYYSNHDCDLNRIIKSLLLFLFSFQFSTPMLMRKVAVKIFSLRAIIHLAMHNENIQENKIKFILHNVKYLIMYLIKNYIIYISLLHRA